MTCPSCSPLGRWLQRRVRLGVVRYVGGAICAVLAGLTLAAAVT